MKQYVVDLLPADGTVDKYFQNCFRPLFINGISFLSPFLCARCYKSISQLYSLLSPKIITLFQDPVKPKTLPAIACAIGALAKAGLSRRCLGEACPCRHPQRDTSNKRRTKAAHPPTKEREIARPPRKKPPKTKNPPRQRSLPSTGKYSPF